MKKIIVVLLGLLLAPLALVAAVASEPAGRFTIAVIPDSQNYLDFKRQRAAGFPIDASELFMDQMAFVSRNLEANGGSIAFVTHVGDVWQHPTEGIDAAHRAMGLKDDPENPIVKRYGPDGRTVTVEMSGARRAFRLLGGKIPMSVVPGNHDYDSFWADSRFPVGTGGVGDASKSATPYGVLHYAGLSNFNAVFGADSEFFRDRSWYVASFNGGANSAQVFAAGGYRFLHIGLEMAPHDDVLEWATSIINRYPGMPTLITIHDHLNVRGEQQAIPGVDFKKVHAEHNNPRDVWEKLLSRHAQIFMVFSGHQHGQSRRVDVGADGGKVWQLLADYQDRNRALEHLRDVPERRGGLGDGWLRLLEFDFAEGDAKVRVRTYSTYFNAYASDLPDYASWYKGREQPQMTDEQFLAEDEFSLVLDDFVKRFGRPVPAGR